MTAPEGPVSPIPPTRRSGPFGRDPGTDWIAMVARPRVILLVLAVVLACAVIFTPDMTGGTEMRLTTYSKDPGAAGGLYEVLQRLGWPTQRRLVAFRPPLDSNAVYAVLGGPDPMTTSETTALLNAVRRGAGLVYVVGSQPLDDSLPMVRSDTGASLVPVRRADTAGCQKEARLMTLLGLGGGLRLYTLQPRHALSADTAVFVSVGRSAAGIASVPAVVGYPLGRGRIVLMSDPDVLRNDVIRVCRMGIGPRVVAAFAYASRGEQRPVVFDEYHQGRGAHAGVPHAVGAFLATQPLGQAIVQLLIGSLVLLWALGVRAIAPRAVGQIERRSPLEHVDALARAYEQVGATRTAAMRLASGLRRRHDRGGWALRSAHHGGFAMDPDARFLSTVAAGHPRVASDVTHILDAERHAVPTRDLLAVAAAVDHVDAVFPASHIPQSPHPLH